MNNNANCLGDIYNNYHNSIFANIMNKDNNKFTFCNYNTNLSKDYKIYNFNFLNISNFNYEINNNNYLYPKNNGNEIDSFHCNNNNNISNNLYILNNLITNDLNINYINIIQNNYNQKNQNLHFFEQVQSPPTPKPAKKISIEKFIKFLKNIQMPIIDYVCNTKGALELQKMLEKSGSDMKMYFIQLLKRDGLTEIMKNVHGNYFFQKLIKDSTEKIISKILVYILEDFIDLSKDDSGTFSVQALLDEVSSINDINKILQKIHEIEMIYDKNATYVIQKIVMKFNDFYRRE